MGSQKVSGFGYNAEDYDAATGMLNLRARQYESAMNRFGQKDRINGQASEPLSLNRYAYVQNNPKNYFDPTGMIAKAVGLAKGDLAVAVSGTKTVANNVSSAAKAAESKAKQVTPATTEPSNPETFGEYAAYWWAGLEQWGSSILSAPKQRMQAVMDDPGNIWNWLDYGTWGITGAFVDWYNGNRMRTQELIQEPTLLNAINWATSGGVDTLEAALTVDPENPSKQWAASFNIVSGSFVTYHMMGGCSVLRPSSLGTSLRNDLPTYGYDRWPDSSTFKSVETTKSAKPIQQHHFATNKNSVFTPQMNEIAQKYGLNLNGGWNKAYMSHLGRHPNAYHTYVLEQMRMFDTIAQGNTAVFLELFEQMKQSIIRNPEILTKKYWNSR